MGNNRRLQRAIAGGGNSLILSRYSLGNVEFYKLTTGNGFQSGLWPDNPPSPGPIIGHRIDFTEGPLIEPGTAADELREASGQPAAPPAVPLVSLYIQGFTDPIELDEEGSAAYLEWWDGITSERLVQPAAPAVVMP